MNNISRNILRGALCLTVSFSAVSCGLWGNYKSSQETVEAESVTIPSYKDIFREQELIALIDTALANNLDYMISHEHVAQAKEQILGAKLAFAPRLFAGDQSAVTFHNPVYGASLTQPSTWTYTLGSASWELDIFGKLTNKKKMAQSDWKQAIDFEQAARVELISSVATLYYTLQVLDAQIKATDEAEMNWYKSVVAMRDLKASGQNDEAAVAQFEGSYYMTRVQAKQLRLTRQQTENALKLLLCKGDDYVIARGELMDVLKSLQINGSRIDSIDMRALRVRPDVKAAEMNLAKAFYNVNYARGCFCPSITISGGVGFMAGNVIFSAVGGLVEPILNAGDNLVRLRVSKSQLKEMEMNYAKALLNAGTEANNAIIACKSHIGQIEDCANRVSSMSRALEATQLKMDFGRGTYLEVLTAQNDLLNAQNEEIQNTGDALISYVELYKSLGGGKE